MKTPQTLKRHGYKLVFTYLSQTFKTARPKKFGVESSLPHRRSVDAKIRRITRKYILENAYRCPIWAETIARTNQTEVVDHLTATLTIKENLQLRRVLQMDEDETLTDSKVSQILDVKSEKGLVLTDSRGRGAFQK